VVGPSLRSGEAVTPPRSRLSPSPGVGRGGDRLSKSRLSPSPGVGRGGDRLPKSRLSPSPGVGRGGDRLSESRLSPSPGHGDFCALLASRDIAATFFKAGCTHAKIVNKPNFSLSPLDLVNILGEARSIGNKFITQIWAKGGRE
jgi:hypothetical protein